MNKHDSGTYPLPAELRPALRERAAFLRAVAQRARELGAHEAARTACERLVDTMDSIDSCPSSTRAA